MGLLDTLKAKYVRHKLEEALSPYDTEVERNEMADNNVKAGMAPMVANLIAVVQGIIVAALQDVATGGNLGELLSKPKNLGLALLSAILFRLAHSLNPPEVK